MGDHDDMLDVLFERGYGPTIKRVIKGAFLAGVIAGIVFAAVVWRFVQWGLS